MNPIDDKVDEAIYPYVSVLRQKGFNTFMSCQGGMPDKTSKHACWCPTIGVCPFSTSKDYRVYTEYPDNNEAYQEYLRLVNFVTKSGWPCFVSLKICHPNNDEGKFVSFLELEWMVPLDWSDNDKYPKGTFIEFSPKEIK